jgi:hypothetical protein
MSNKRGRPAEAPLTSDDQLGSIKAVAIRLGVGRTWLGGVKRRQVEINRMAWLPGERPDLPTPAFACNKTCATWVREFIRHPFNAGFSPAASYRKAPR